MHQCADDGRERYPIAAAVVKRDYYMDDLTTGTDTVDQAIQLYHQMTELMK